jgi:mRNA-degrading endonuclease RelE of RelBE toxin-antitoxin system
MNVSNYEFTFLLYLSFLDDALEPNRKSLKVKVKKLKDPLREEVLKRINEDNYFNTDENNKPKLNQSNSRVILEVEHWASGKIEAKMMKKVRKMDETRLKSCKSKIVFDHFNTLRGNEVVRAEVPRGIRTYPELL